MDVSEALEIVDSAFKQKHCEERHNRQFTHVYELVFREAWQGKTYHQIALDTGYDFDYVREVGSNLWTLLSECLGEKVHKKNLQSVLKRYKEQVKSEVVNSSQNLKPLPTFHQDWGGAPDVAVFYGRIPELTALEQWIVGDCCRLVAILGIGGMGKTALSVTLAEEIQEHFDYIIWRSLYSTPSVMQTLAELIEFLSDRQELNLPTVLSDRISCLIKYLRKHRCLVILDNAESILKSSAGEVSQQVGNYIEDYEGYSELFKRLGESPHLSCLILTGREQPREFALLAGDKVRSWHLGGLSKNEAKALFKAKGEFIGLETDWDFLIEHYGGNPLALKIVAGVIQEFFNHDLSRLIAQIQQDRWVFEDIHNLLEQHFERLSESEKHVMYWLTVIREIPPLANIPLEELPTNSRQEFFQALDSLRRRSMIEKTSDGFYPQPLVLEYITEKLVKESYRKPESKTPAS